VLPAASDPLRRISALDSEVRLSSQQPPMRTSEIEGALQILDSGAALKLKFQ
jgi:hypothetical protein